MSTPATARNPWLRFVLSRDDLSTAENYLDDAVGEVMADEIPKTAEQAEQRRAAVARHIRDAERSIERAKRRLGIDAEEVDDAA